MRCKAGVATLIQKTFNLWSSTEFSWNCHVTLFVAIKCLLLHLWFTYASVVFLAIYKCLGRKETQVEGSLDVVSMGCVTHIVSTFVGMTHPHLKGKRSS